MDNSDLAVILLLLMLVMAAYLFPGGPGTPLRMRAGLEAYPTG